MWLYKKYQYICDSTHVEVFYSFVKLNTQPNVRCFYNKISILIYFVHEFLKKTEDMFWCSLVGNNPLFQVYVINC